jgi:FkbM family methyltransferase
MLTTKTKVALAGAAYRVVSFGRSVIGKNDEVVVERHGIRWQLDLREGIDFSIYLLGAFEPGTQATLKKLVKPGDVVFDVGANIGAHTLGIAQSAGPQGRVFAFEPTDFAFEKLCRNLALNPDLAARTSPQQILLAASSSDRSEPQIHASWPLQRSNDVHPKHRGRLVSTARASVDTLDSFVARNKIDRLNLIKIDVDGHELPVLQGALETLRRFRPMLVMEMSPYIHAEHNHAFADFVALLKSLDYSLRDTDSNEAVPLDLAQLEHLIPDGASINVVATPNRAEEILPWATETK